MWETRGAMQNVRVPTNATPVVEPLELFSSDAPVAMGPAERHYVFVTAPFGGLSAVVARYLRAGGARATRILLSVGDVIDWGVTDCTPFRGDQSDWGDWITQYLRRETVTDLVVFGDSHTYCISAMAAASRLGVRVHVLEEGYFRPHWITLERDGVNGMSRLPRSPEFYRGMAERHPESEFVPVGKITPAAVRNISLYFTAQVLGAPLFPRFQPPNPYRPTRQALGHIRRYAAQKLNGKRYQRDLHAVLAVSGPIFLVALQRPGDSQLLRHSSFETVAAFIEHVVASFARQAPPGVRLLFKSHPLDHGLEPHEIIIKRAAEACGVADRVFYTDIGHFPSLVRASAGLVSVNSTAGLSAIEFQKPTIVLGDAIYDMPGLTHQSGLDHFWSAPEAPDPSLYRAFRTVVMAKTQINGAYSTRHGVRLAAPEVARRLLAC
jgi:capsular polysaccharide export protein